MANNLKLKKISVRGLYSLYDYDIDFSNCAHPSVVFLTAPNGYGKTTILQLVDHFFRGAFSYFVQEKLKFTSICFYLSKYTVKISQHRRSIQDIDDDENSYYVEALVQVFRSSGKTPFESSAISSLQSDHDRNECLPKTLLLYLKSNSVHLISDDRLWVKTTKYTSHLTDLCTLVQVAIEKHNYELTDRFNKYLVEHMQEILPPLGYNSKDVSKLVKLLSRYHAVGLATDIKENMLSNTDSPVAISYYQSARQVLDPKDDLLIRLELLSSRISKCEFVNKTALFRISDGLMFEMNDELKTKVLPEELSSGEKQIVVQTIELLFCAVKGSLVLIDEPELSYHVAWQMSYFDYIVGIASQRQLQCIISTHSPQMFDYNWEATVDLFTQQESLTNSIR